MTMYPEKGWFSIQVCTDDVAAVTESCLAVFRKSTYQVPDEVLQKARWVMTELLLNAVKHTGDGGNELYLEAAEDQIIIARRDTGKPFSIPTADGLQLTWPLANEHIKGDFQLYHNGLDTLMLEIDESGNAQFRVDESEEIEMPLLLSHTSEHFGLMIIAKASSQFTYSFDTTTKTNLFTVTIAF